MGLEEGKQYTLTIDLKRTLVWAGSNGYWNGALTFDAPGAGDAAQKKQGVLFKWGSLVGISGAGEEEYPYENVYGTQTTVYTPYAITGSSYGWDSSLHPAWEDIISEEFSIMGETYLSDDARNNGYNPSGEYWSKKKGDICRFISENGFGPGGATDKYRMPTRSELGQKDTYTIGSDGWTRYPTGTWYSVGTDADGSIQMGNYVSNSYSGIILPASGLRGPSTGELALVAESGYYWSCTALGTGSASTNVLQIARTGLWISGSVANYAYSVRCVRAN
jgi:hypothetical protein